MWTPLGQGTRQGHFTLTISGPAQFLPELQAGIEAKKAELQRERDAAAQHADAADDVAALPRPELVQEPPTVAEEPPVPRLDLGYAVAVLMAQAA